MSHSHIRLKDQILLHLIVIRTDEYLLLNKMNLFISVVGIRISECINTMSTESNAQRKRQPDRPFYLPKGETTSSRIITEAKESLNNRTGLQAVVTKRPCTPRDATRSLFGATSTRAPENRPPSSFRFVSH